MSTINTRVFVSQLKDVDKEDVVYIYIYIHTHTHTMGYYAAIKRNEILHLQRRGWN